MNSTAEVPYTIFVVVVVDAGDGGEDPTGWTFEGEGLVVLVDIGVDACQGDDEDSQQLERRAGCEVSNRVGVVVVVGG